MPPREPSEILRSARQAHESFEQDTDVARSAAEQLDRSRRAFDKAERLWADGADPELVDHYAYLAVQYAEIAQEEAQQARLRKDIEWARERRREILLEITEREAMSARQRAKELQRQLADLQARETARGMVLTLGDVLFDLNEASLKPGGRRAAVRMAEFLSEHPQRRIRVEGHTDSLGPEQYNEDLSRRRAEAVKQEIVKHGISPARISTEGYGERFPVASNDNEAGRLRNRRVEIVISDTEGRVEDR